MNNKYWYERLVEIGHISIQIGLTIKGFRIFLEPRYMQKQLDLVLRLPAAKSDGFSNSNAAV